MLEKIERELTKNHNLIIEKDTELILKVERSK